MKTSLFAALAVAALVLAAAAQQAGQGDGARIQHLFRQDVRAVRSLPDLTAGPAAELLARTGLDGSVLKTLRRYEVESGQEAEAHRAAFLDAEWRGRKVRLGAASSPGGATTGLFAYNEFGDAVEEADAFLAQFRGGLGLRLSPNSTAPVGEVMTRRDEILAEDKAPARKDLRQAWVLLRHRLLMWDMGERFDRLLELGADPGADLGAGLRALDDAARKVDEFKSYTRALMKPKSAAEYSRLLDEMRAQVADAQQRFEAGEIEAAAKVVQGKLKLSCSRCHGYDGNEWKKPFEVAVREQREKAGFGAGWFVVDVDVRRMGLEPDEAQVLASTVKALLLTNR